ncbi:MAG: hypothetical protein ACPG49_06485 [Chitinophagales bacterium]
MNDSSSIKNKLYKACETNITHRIDNIRQRLESIKESIKNETKSSVGDKHETGRVMMQLEAENTKVQFASALQTKKFLSSIDHTKTFRTAQKGSLVITNQANYYLAIGIGKVMLEGNVYYCISQDSPIAKRLRGKKIREEIDFNGKKITLKEIY